MKRQRLLRADVYTPAAAHALNGAHPTLLFHHFRYWYPHITHFLTFPAGNTFFFICLDTVKSGNTQYPPERCIRTQDTAEISVAGQRYKQKACIIAIGYKVIVEFSCAVVSSACINDHVPKLYNKQCQR